MQRIPPTEKRGRVHTSTVTVAVISAEGPSITEVRESDLRWDFFASGGPGGMNQNAVNSGARVYHSPSGLMFECREERNQHQNRQRCLEKLRRALREGAHSSHHQKQNDSRRSQVGSGERGDKIRTYSIPRNSVVDHRTGTKWPFDKLERGEWWK